jgi:AcrR family transcriptional regulator
MPGKRRRQPIQQRKSPRQERSRATVEAILQAAAYILVRQGYDAFTTNSVAERAGVNIASLYQYFPNKEAIFAELYRRHVAESRAAMLAALRAGDAARDGGRAGSSRTVRRMVCALIAAHSVAPELHRIFTQEGARLGLPPIATEADGAIAEMGARWVESVRGRHKNAELALWVAGTATHALIHAAFAERPADATSDALIDEITRLLTSYWPV